MRVRPGTMSARFLLAFGLFCLALFVALAIGGCGGGGRRCQQAQGIDPGAVGRGGGGGQSDPCAVPR